VIRFCPLKILFDSFYTVKTQNLPEFQRIYKGQKIITQSFFEIKSAHKDETFFGSFQTLCIGCNLLLSSTRSRGTKSLAPKPNINRRHFFNSLHSIALLFIVHDEKFKNAKISA